jgi:hypothetical protein
MAATALSLLLLSLMLLLLIMLILLILLVLLPLRIVTLLLFASISHQISIAWNRRRCQFVTFLCFTPTTDSTAAVAALFAGSWIVVVQ